MTRSTKAILRQGTIAFVVSLAVSVGLSIALTSNGVHSSQEGSRNFWSASQKANAVLVLTSYPVSESPQLATCVIDQVSQQHSFTEFLQYATLASLNDFSNPDATQVSVINSLMYDALTCPQVH